MSSAQKAQLPGRAHRPSPAHTLQKSGFEHSPQSRPAPGFGLEAGPVQCSSAQKNGSHQSAPVQRNSAQQNSPQQSPVPSTPSQGEGPIQCMTLYAHGFVPRRDFLGNNFRHNVGERVFREDYNGYWDDAPRPWTEEDTQRDGKHCPPPSQERQEASVGEQMLSHFADDGPTYYFDGSAGPFSSARSRMSSGRKGADELDQGQIRTDASDAKLDDEELEKKNQARGPQAEDAWQDGEQEPVFIVGHSMGAAYAAGLATRLQELNQARISADLPPKYDLQAVYYLAPHQPVDIQHPSDIFGVQYSHPDDTVSTMGLLSFFSGSKLGPIQGIAEEHFLQSDAHDCDNPNWNENVLFAGKNGYADRGGHNVQEQVYLFEEMAENGIVPPWMQEKVGQPS